MKKILKNSVKNLIKLFFLSELLLLDEMGKKKKNLKKKEGNYSKELEPIEFQTEFPIEILRVSSEFLPCKILLQNVLLVSKEAKKIVEDIITERRKNGMTDYSSTRIVYEYVLNNKIEIKNYVVLDKSTGRFLIEYIYKEKQVIAILDPNLDGTNHIFEISSKQKDLKYQSFTPLGISDQIMIYTWDCIDIYDIKSKKILYKIKLETIETMDQKIHTMENVLFFEERLQKIFLIKTGLLCLKCAKSALFYYYDGENLKFIDSIRLNYLNNIYHLENNTYLFFSSPSFIYNLNSKQKNNIDKKIFDDSSLPYQLDEKNFLIKTEYDEDNNFSYNYNIEKRKITKLVDWVYTYPIKINGEFYIFDSKMYGHKLEYNNEEYQIKESLFDFIFDYSKEDFIAFDYNEKEKYFIFTSKSKINVVTTDILGYHYNKIENITDVISLDNFKFLGVDKTSNSIKIFEFLTK